MSSTFFIHPPTEKLGYGPRKQRLADAFVQNCALIERRLDGFLSPRPYDNGRIDSQMTPSRPPGISSPPAPLLPRLCCPHGQRLVRKGVVLPCPGGGRHLLPQDVEHLQPHVHRRRQLVGSHRRGIERVGIVRSQLELLRQDARGRVNCPDRSVVAAIGAARRSARSNSSTWAPGTGAPEGSRTRPSIRGSAPA